MAEQSLAGRKGRRSRRLFTRVQPAVEIELIEMLFATKAPALVIGAIAAAIGAQAGWHGDVRTLSLCLLIAAAAVGRLAVLARFGRRGDSQLDLTEARGWESRYAWTSYAIAAAVGLTNLNGLRMSDPIISMLIVGTLFAYAFSLALRVSVRPRICLLSILVALAPTAFGIIAYAPPGSTLSPAMTTVTGLTIIFTLCASILAMVPYTFNLQVSQIASRNVLAQVARRDALTGLLNRIGLRERFDEEIAALADGRSVALHYLDLDRFKAVNDSSGHHVGDALLRQAASRMAMAVRADDAVARLGGDEFVIIQCGIGIAADAEILAKALIAAVSDVYAIDGMRLWVGATIGIAMIPRDGLSLDPLLIRADAALYRAKREGRGTYAFVGPEQTVERRSA